MRSAKALLTDLVKKPPLLFPLVGLFHILWVVYTVWSDRAEPFPDMVWLQVLWLLAYTTCWLGACDMRRWGATGYILLTLLNVSLYLGIRNGAVPRDYLSNLFLIDGLFSVFLLFYYKQFGK